MRRAHWIEIGLVALSTTVLVGPVAQGQLPSSTISLTSGVTLKTFTPIDSLFLNPTATKFTIALVHTVTGTPSDYRVSRFSDFRDANWIPYNPQPSITLANSVFTPTPGNSSSSQAMLYLQLRAKNPKAGQPVSLIDGKTTVQPDFFFSSALGRRIRIVFAG
jgi:hypothetical protein